MIPARRKDTEYEKPLSNAFGSDDLDALLPARRKDAENEKPVLNVGEDKLKLDPLSDRIVTILKDGKVINFDLLIKLLDDPLLSADRVLQTLPSVGLLVQGNWTVLSEILYPEKSLSGTNGVPADLMCRARDYVVRSGGRTDFACETFDFKPPDCLFTLSSSSNCRAASPWIGHASPSSRKYRPTRCSKLCKAWPATRSRPVGNCCWRPIVNSSRTTPGTRNGKSFTGAPKRPSSTNWRRPIT